MLCYIIQYSIIWLFCVTGGLQAPAGKAVRSLVFPATSRSGKSYVEAAAFFDYYYHDHFHYYYYYYHQ